MALSTSTRQRLLFAILCLVWGSTFLALKAGVTVVPPGIFSGLRWTLAGAVLLVFRAARGQPVLVSPQVAWRVLWVAVIMISVNAVIMLYGLRYTPSGLGSVVSSAFTPITLLGFAVALGQEQFTRRHFYALAVGVAGILLLFGPQALEGQLRMSELLGAGGILLGTVCYSYASVLARPMMRTLPPVQMAGLTNVMGGVVLIVGSLAFEPGAWHAMRLDWGPSAWAGFLFLLLAGSLGATIIYFFLVRDWGASRTGTYAFISPIVAVLLGMAVFGETVHATDAAGMALMLLAAGIVLRKPSA
ncbi:MAG TPA: EamA family transporter [Acetobacteraceae bacterium]|jgi:drug/metabolite transporter (DMT)-like permease|nr:EamA family transporter [Acetobacteraceae bacterium]